MTVRVELRCGVASDVGLVRRVNEDSYLAEPPVFVVADGMGGHDGGDIASRIVVEAFAGLGDLGPDASSAHDAVLTSLRAAQQRLLDYAATHRGRDGGPWHGGTTTVAALVVEADAGPEWLLVNIGDSRVYRFARGELVRVSTDHSVVQELVDAGRITEEQARHHPERHIVTRAVGGPDPLDPDLFSVALTDAERVMLCSDGVTDLLVDRELAQILVDNADPQDAAQSIVAAALAAGGIDNATALVVDVVGLPSEGLDDPDDSRRRNDSPHEKLGVLP